LAKKRTFLPAKRTSRALAGVVAFSPRREGSFIGISRDENIVPQKRFCVCDLKLKFQENAIRASADVLEFEFK
jgi:hypothetical protein